MAKRYRNDRTNHVTLQAGTKAIPVAPTQEVTISDQDEKAIRATQAGVAYLEQLTALGDAPDDQQAQQPPTLGGQQTAIQSGSPSVPPSGSPQPAKTATTPTGQSADAQGGTQSQPHGQTNTTDTNKRK